MPNQGSVPSRLGTVEDVNGASVSIKIDASAPSGLLFVDGEAYRIGQVGGFVRIPSGYVDLYGVISQVGAGAAPSAPEVVPNLGNRWLKVELVGQGRKGTRFERGIAQYPSIGDTAHVVTESDLKAIYAPDNDEGHVAIGNVASADSIKAYLNLNKLISRHSAILGSTGSGKSNAVASLLTTICDQDRFKSARVVLLDLHGEYSKSFEGRARVFRVGADHDVGERELHIPFWALTAEEFVAIAMGPLAGTPQVLAYEKLLEYKRNSRPKGSNHGMSDLTVTVDTPLPFSVYKLWHDLYSLHCSTHSVSKNQNQTVSTRTFAKDESSGFALEGHADGVERPKFKPLKDVRDEPDKVYASMYADLPRAHLDFLENKLRDPRMQFLFRPGAWSVATDNSTEADLDSLLQHWIGNEFPMSVFDLSGIPITVLEDLVGALLRILYDSVFWGRSKPEGGRERPLLIVMEEAHVYLGAQSKSRAASAARRIAKEGRKYGVGLMLVSQRPAEIDPTILSQCGTVIALRLTNESDRGQVASCASDNLKGLFSMLPVLRTGEALITGEAVSLPMRAIIEQPPVGKRPDSDDPQVVVPRDHTGARTRRGGWTEAVEEDYAPLVESWRRQEPNAKRSDSYQ